MEKDSDSESDIDVRTQFYQWSSKQFSAELKPGEPSTSSCNIPRPTSITFATVTPLQQSAATTATAPFSILQTSQDISDIEDALRLNKLMDEKYQKLEQTLIISLNECQEKLKALRDNRIPQEHDKNFNYIKCSRPYFNDHRGYPAPSNSDTLLIKQLDLYDFTMTRRPRRWTAKDRVEFSYIMLEISQNIKLQQLLENVSELKQIHFKTGMNVDDEIATVTSEIRNVKNLKLEEVALPLEQEYDWEMIASKLHRRHEAKEYRAFWKMFYHPSINKTSWSKAEQKKLLEIASTHNYQDWEKIAKELNTGRTCYQCFLFYKTNNRYIKSTEKKWTKDEIENLKKVVSHYKQDQFIPWSTVTAAIENRTRIQVYNKYKSLSERKGRFIPEEDSIIWSCYKKYGMNFKKMTEFLPGRCISQVKTRFHILKNNVSAIWTVEADRKLLQLIANDDSKSQLFANATLHFPDKTRTQIRSRYQTLMKWMKKRPDSDLSEAPRRPVRRLTRCIQNDDLDRAVKSLEQKINSEEQLEDSNKVKRDFTDAEIEDGIIATLLTEINDEEDSDSVDDDAASLNTKSASSTNKRTGYENLKNILLLLNSALRPYRVKNSVYSQKFPNLFDKANSTYGGTVKIKSYSKIEKETTATLNKSLNTRGSCILGPVMHVLPPNYATITACKLLAMNLKERSFKPEIDVDMLMRHNIILKEQMRLLIERFNFLFTWPLVLSALHPPVANLTRNAYITKSNRTDTDASSNISTKKLRHIAAKTLSKENIKQELQSVFEDSNSDSDSDLEVINVEDFLTEDNYLNL